MGVIKENFACLNVSFLKGVLRTIPGVILADCSVFLSAFLSASARFKLTFLLYLAKLTLSN